jgi:5-methylcytosine-specific restriction enzyme subunit McrC
LIEIEPLRAWGSGERELPPRVAAELAASGVVAVTPLADGRWLLRADSMVGVLAGEGWELQIHPHLEISKLLFLLSYSLRPQGWEGPLTAMATERDLVHALASGFCMHAERVIERGLVRGYLQVHERRNDLRGSVRFKEQLTRLAGRALPLEVAYDEFTTDILENQLLRTATERLLLLARLPAPVRARLARLRGALVDVSVLGARGRAELPRPTPLNERYEAALLIASLILEGTSIRLQRGHVALRSFIFDLNEVFESFVFVALREALGPYGGVLARQVCGSLCAGASAALRLRPDILWRKHGGVRAVVDSKYKHLLQSAPTPSEDVYQMLAYCIGFGLRRGTLIYVCEGPWLPRVHEIRRHGYEIDVCGVDLADQPEAILTRIGAIAAAIAARAPSDMDRKLSLTPALAPAC